MSHRTGHCALVGEMGLALGPPQLRGTGPPLLKGAPFTSVSR